VQDRDMLQWNTNRKSYVVYRIALLPMSFNDHEGHFCCLKLFELPYLVKRDTNLLIQRVARFLCSSKASCLSCVVLAKLNLCTKFEDSCCIHSDDMRESPEF